MLDGMVMGMGFAVELGSAVEDAVEVAIVVQIALAPKTVMLQTDKGKHR